MKTILILVSVLLFSTFSFAKGGGDDGSSIAFNLGFSSPTQDDMNGVVTTVNNGGGHAEKLGTGYIFGGYYQYRFQSSMFAIQFRPQMFSQSSSGGGYDAKLTGLSVFPILRLYPLENGFIHFFMQVGLGWGSLKGEMGSGGNKVEFGGSAFGAMGGLGAEFCFNPAHCIVVEGNLKYLPIERNLATSVQGTPVGFSQAVSGQEVEVHSTDLATTMSGIEGILSYKLNF